MQRHKAGRWGGCRETWDKDGYLEDIRREERSKDICRRERVTQPGWQRGKAEYSCARIVQPYALIDCDFALEVSDWERLMGMDSGEGCKGPSSVHFAFLQSYDEIVWYHCWKGDIHRETEQVSHGEQQRSQWDDPCRSKEKKKKKENMSSIYLSEFKLSAMFYVYLVCHLICIMVTIDNCSFSL